MSGTGNFTIWNFVRNGLIMNHRYVNNGCCYNFRTNKCILEVTAPEGLMKSSGEVSSTFLAPSTYLWVQFHPTWSNCIGVTIQNGFKEGKLTIRRFYRLVPWKLKCSFFLYVCNFALWRYVLIYLTKAKCPDKTKRVENRSLWLNVFHWCLLRACCIPGTVMSKIASLSLETLD